MIKSRDKNVTDFNVADYVRSDIKLLVTKTRYTVLLTWYQNTFTKILSTLAFDLNFHQTMIYLTM